MRHRLHKTQTVLCDHCPVTEVKYVSRRKKHETTCSSLEACPHRFLKYLGSAHLPGIDGVVTCGYEHNEKSGQREQICYVFYRHWEQWTRIYVFPDRVMFDGASVAWHDKLGRISHRGHITLSLSKTVQLCLAATISFTMRSRSPELSGSSNSTL